jgi:hypothetical protein
MLNKIKRALSILHLAESNGVTLAAHNISRPEFLFNLIFYYKGYRTSKNGGHDYYELNYKRKVATDGRVWLEHLYLRVCYH